MPLSHKVINAVLRRTGENRTTLNENEVFSFGMFEFSYPEQLLKSGLQQIQLTKRKPRC